MKLLIAMTNLNKSLNFESSSRAFFSLMPSCLWLNVVRFSRDSISLCIPRSIELDCVRPNLVHDFFRI